MHAHKDQDGTRAVMLRLLSRYSGCGKQPANDAPIDEKDRASSARVRGAAGRVFRRGERVW